MKKISLCVPTYNRPDTLQQLINSFLKQNYKNKELVLSDDTPNESIRDLVKVYKNKNIKYFHNKKALGFSRNLLKSMERATGDYIIVLGDDDVLFDEEALSSYVHIFDSKKSVGFIYSNMVQFSDQMDIQYAINFFPKSKMFKKGKESMEQMWIRSIFIGGIGIRNSKDLSKWYPDKKILHPQVEFIGHILNQYDSYLIAKTNIGFRSHDDQIIFRALRNKKIRQEGEHMTVELFDIFTMLKKQYNLQMYFDFVAKELIEQMLIMMFKEKSYLGTEEMEKNYKRFCALSKTAKESKKLKVAYLLAKLFPATMILFARESALELVAFNNRGQNKILKKQLMKMITA